MRTFKALFLICSFFLAASIVGAQTPSESSPAGQIIALQKAAVGDDILLAFVAGYSAPFALSVNDIIALKNSGVSNAVMIAVMNHDSSLRASVPTIVQAPVTVVPGVVYNTVPAPYPVIVYPNRYYWYNGYWGPYYRWRR